MKRFYTLLLITVACLSACKKENAVNQVQSIASKQTNSLSTTTTTATTNTNTTAISAAITASFRIKLAKDSVNTDNTLVNFSTAAKATYVPNEDAPYFAGFGLVSLASLSSNNIPLAVNALPLPVKSISIGLKVGAKSDGVYNLTMTTVKVIPILFDVWLMDNYKKDSLNFRNNPSYNFNLYVADTNSYASKRFSIVIRQNKVLAVHLLNFTAVQADGGVRATWVTENEFNYTIFSIERSADYGATFSSLTTLTSAAGGTYTFLDKTPPSGTDIYRLKLTDLNGAVVYSSGVAVTN
jgi:trimeric autotransporter adhesin